MTAPIAFGGDAQVKADLLARIDSHIAAGTLILHDTAWDGTSGSPLGVSIEGTDPLAYATAYGYPLPIVPLLDGLAVWPAEDFDAIGFVRDWVTAVKPGADLSAVPTLLMLHMLDDHRLRGIDDTLLGRLIDLHLSELAGSPAPRREWGDLRRAILAIEPSPDDRPLRLAVGMWEAAAWPATHGRSTLTGAFSAWRLLQSLFHDPAWNAEDEARKDSLLQMLWADHAPAREAGEFVDYPALFEARDRDLAIRYVANLTRTNRHIASAHKMLAEQCIALFRDT